MELHVVVYTSQICIQALQSRQARRAGTVLEVLSPLFAGLQDRLSPCTGTEAALAAVVLSGQAAADAPEVRRPITCQLAVSASCYSVGWQPAPHGASTTVTLQSLFASQQLDL